MTEEQLRAFVTGIQPVAQMAGITYQSLRAQKLPRLTCCVLTAVLLWRFTGSMAQQQIVIPPEILAQIHWRDTA